MQGQHAISTGGRSDGEKDPEATEDGRLKPAHTGQGELSTT